MSVGCVFSLAESNMAITMLAHATVLTFIMGGFPRAPSDPPRIRHRAYLPSGKVLSCQGRCLSNNRFRRQISTTLSLHACV